MSADTTSDAVTLRHSKGVLNLLNRLFKLGRGNTPAIDKTTTQETAQHLMEGVYKGYGANFGTIEYNTPDYRKLAHLERNVYQFSGAKNYHMLRDLTDALREGDKILPFRDFKAKAEPILNDYNGTWLKTEYNAAVSGSQMASKWVEFEQHPGALLEYRTAEDERVRASHALLNGITRPVDDSFWKTHYPPNGWNCRCTVVRLRTGTGKATPPNDVSLRSSKADIPTLFHTNLAENGLVFPKGSAYYIGLPKDIKSDINKIIPNRSKD